ncbi:MAG: Gx transporter family protein [Actinobacteria bacterium]|nr:Gx transporter family protein [Actinomycetota bacterium]
MWSTADRVRRVPIPPGDRRAYLVSRLGLLVALGLVLQILEGMLPPVLPLPGAKLGLANLATIIALVSMGTWEALVVNVLRCLLGGLLRGSFIGLTLSLAAGTAATLVMAAVRASRLPGVSLTGMSVAGAVTHNAAQLGVAVWLVGFPGLRHYLPYLLLIAVPTGFVIGIVARRLLLALSGGLAAARDRSPSHSPSHIWDNIPDSERPGGEPALRVSGAREREAAAVGKAAAAPERAPARRGVAVLFEGVSLSYPGREGSFALRDVDLSVGEGEFVAVTGPNGSGKSTLCRLVNGLLLPTEGRVTVHGLDTSLPADLTAIRASVGMIMQDPDHQIVASTVEEDVAFGPENLGLPREEIAVRVEEALRLAGLAAMRRRQSHLLSLGEKKRLALAGALAMRPRLLLCDECTEMLDAPGREELLLTLLRLREEHGLTLLFVTHRPDEMLLADRLLLLEGGRITYDGTPRAFFQEKEILERCRLRPPQLLLLARELEERGLRVSPCPSGVPELVEEICASP